MYEPPPDPRDHRASEEPTWRAVLGRFAALAAVPLLLLLVSRPMIGSVGIVAVAVVGVCLWRGVRLARCFVQCGGFAVDVGGRVQICVVRPDVDAACE